MLYKISFIHSFIHLHLFGLKINKFIMSSFHPLEVVSRASETQLQMGEFFFSIYLFNSYSAGIDFSRQNLTSVDVRFGDRL